MKINEFAAARAKMFLLTRISGNKSFFFLVLEKLSLGIIIWVGTENFLKN